MRTALSIPVRRVAIRLAVCTALVSCAGTGPGSAPGFGSGATDSDAPLPGVDASATPVQVHDVPVSRAPYDTVHVTWKQRLDQPYVFVEHRGDYRQIGRSISALLRTAEELGVAPTGAVFCLFYDDPGLVAIDALRARACVPVGRPVEDGNGLRYDVLPGTTVAYAVVQGPTWDVPRAYPGIFSWLEGKGWVENGPLREVYLNLGAVTQREELLTEIQVPWTVRG